MSLVDIATLQSIAQTEFAGIVANVDSETNRMRVFLIDDSFLDVWYSLENKGRYSYPWEHRHLDGTLYRHNKAPHKKWNHVTTFPKHLHDGSEERVAASGLSDQPPEALREMLIFAVLLSSSSDRTKRQSVAGQLAFSVHRELLHRHLGEDVLAVL